MFSVSYPLGGLDRHPAFSLRRLHVHGGVLPALNLCDLFSVGERGSSRAKWSIDRHDRHI